MLAGIVFQLAAIVVYFLCEVEFFLRFFKDRPFARKVTDADTGRGELTTKMKIMVLALLFSTTCLFIRSVYRTAELADGWTGHVIHTQVLFSKFILPSSNLINLLTILLQMFATVL
jgi:hypothetical protein